MTTTTPARASMRGALQRIATGPEYSKDLSRDEARAVMRGILAGTADPVQAGVFLIALRMKRETDEEYLGILDALGEATRAAVAEVPDLVDVSDPYDGFGRILPSSPFLPALLAACGLPAVAHGVERLGPKHGLTHAPVLRAAGAPVDLSPADAARRLADPAIGWAYLDQGAFCPALHALIDLRERIVKRPTLSTVERVLHPVRARHRTWLLAGYVHKAYPRVYAMLARAAGYHGALLVRGVEGGVVPTLRQSAPAFRYEADTADEGFEVDPAALGIEQALRAAPATGSEGGAEAAAVGLAALGGAAGPIRDGLVLAAGLVLWHTRRAPTPVAGAGLAREALDSGHALIRFGAGCARDAALPA